MLWWMQVLTRRIRTLAATLHRQTLQTQLIHGRPNKTLNIDAFISFFFIYTYLATLLSFYDVPIFHVNKVNRIVYIDILSEHCKNTLGCTVEHLP